MPLLTVGCCCLALWCVQGEADAALTDLVKKADAES